MLAVCTLVVLQQRLRSLFQPTTLEHGHVVVSAAVAGPCGSTLSDPWSGGCPSPSLYWPSPPSILS